MINKQITCLASFREFDDCDDACQWYQKNSVCPNGIDKHLKKIIKQQAIKEFMEEVLPKYKTKYFCQRENYWGWNDCINEIKSKAKKFIN